MWGDQERVADQERCDRLHVGCFSKGRPVFEHAVVLQVDDMVGEVIKFHPLVIRTRAFAKDFGNHQRPRAGTVVRGRP
ncbi:TPA: hypothetical protein DEF17_03975 [bacterium]|nr:hypothetical protein [bacterium]